MLQLFSHVVFVTQTQPNDSKDEISLRGFLGNHEKMQVFFFNLATEIDPKITFWAHLKQAKAATALLEQVGETNQTRGFLGETAQFFLGSKEVPWLM